jgi:hypothetical protein
VPPGATAGAHAAAEGQAQVVADVHAGRVACLARLDEPHPGPHEQRLDGRDRDLERRRELVVGEPVDLAHQQRRALLGGEALDVVDQAPQVVAALGDLERVVERPARGGENVGRGDLRPAHLVHAAVVGDPVEPGAQRDRPAVRAQAAVGADEDVLEGVLRVLPRAGEHLARVGEEPLAVAVVDRPEGLVAPGPEQSDELVVAAEPQESRREGDSREPGRGVDGRRFHGPPSDLCEHRHGTKDAV